MSTQINIRLDDETVTALDALADSQGITRAEVVRQAVLLQLRAAQRAAVAEAYERAYSQHPETTEELRRAQKSAQRLTGEETWTRWW